MIFKFKSKPIYLDFFTNNYQTKQLFDISGGNSYKPDWWKKVESRIDHSGIDRRNIKRCAGFLDYFRMSYVVPLPYEVHISINSGRYNLYTPEKGDVTDIVSSAHPPAQRGDYAPEQSYSHVKLPIHWVADCNKDISSIITPPCWTDSLHLDTVNTLSAVRNFYYSHSTQWHFILNKKHNTSFTLNAGIPCYHFTPLTDKKVVVRSHYDPDKTDEILNRKAFNWSFSKSYHKYISAYKRSIKK